MDPADDLLVRAGAAGPARDTRLVGFVRTGGLAAALVLASCGGGAGAGGDWWHPGVATTWQWQLQGPVDTRYPVDAYDVDLAETPDRVLGRLHAAGRRVVCYFSAGTWESFRAGPPPPAPVLGRALPGYPDERWLDIRRPTVRALVAGRLDRAAARGCDGVEPDNVDGYANDTGFPLTAADQLAFLRWMAGAAHDRHLAVGLKNDLDQVPALAGAFDFAVDEQCHQYDECGRLRPFVAAGEPVLEAEYAARFRRSPGPVCADSRRRGLRTLVLPVELDDAFRISCDGLAGLVPGASP